MKKSLKLFSIVAAATIVFVVSSEPMFARGRGAANVMNSPGERPCWEGDNNWY
jgi:hypothetical protein